MDRQSGSALLETITLGLGVLLPLFWLMSVVSELERAATASQTAAREVARSIADGGQTTHDVLARAFRDEGLQPDEASIEVHEVDDPVFGRIVEARVMYPIVIGRIPLLGAELGSTSVVASFRATTSNP